MNKIALIVKREYLSRVKKRSFIIMTLLGPLLFAGVMAAAILVTMAETVEHKVLIVDPEGIITHKIDEIGQYVPNCFDCFPERDHYIYRFAEGALTDSAFIESDYTLMVSLLEGQFEHKQVDLFYKKLPSSIATRTIEGDLENALERARVKAEAALDYETYKRLKVNISLNKYSIDRGNEYNDENAAIGMVFAIIIFFFIFMFGAYVMRGVIEEKTNRIVEVIISSVRPFQLMMGKIIGVGLVAITQVAIWVLFSTIIFSIAGLIFESGTLADSIQAAQEIQGQAPANMDFETYLAQQDGFSIITDTNWSLLLIVFIFYFIGGYVMYASLFAAIGAAVDNETDTQQFMMPVMMPLFFAYFLAIISVNNPEGIAAQVFSIIPLTSPTVMMVRMTAGNVPLWELILSASLLIIACLLMVWMAGKIYRTGILMYGKRPSYKELWKWLFYHS